MDFGSVGGFSLLIFAIGASIVFLVMISRVLVKIPPFSAVSGSDQVIDHGIKCNGCETHLVLKYDDVKKYCTIGEIEDLRIICDKVRMGRKESGRDPDPVYFICNKDEPYAEYTERSILIGEAMKQQAS